MDPFDCPHDSGVRYGEYLVCRRGVGDVWVNCQTSVCGDQPSCVYEEPDNSEEARSRRLAWTRAHEGAAAMQMSLF